MKSKKLLSLILIGGMIFSNTLTVSADTTISEVVETNKLDEIPEEAQTVNVTYISAESLSITIPKTMTLDGTQTNPQTSFNIKVEGDISGTSEVNIHSDEYFYLKQDGKEDVKAVVNYNRTFTSQEVINNTIDMGSVNITTENGNKLSSGEWTGNFKFYINYNGTGTENPETPEVPIIKAAGLYKNDGSFIPWGEFGVVTEGVLQSFDYDFDLSGELILPDNITDIRKVFNAKGNLKTIDLSNTKITALTDNALAGCSNLTILKLPNTLTKIGFSSFGSCSSLKNINYNGTKAEWNSISKDSNWNLNYSPKTITCSDGTITF